ncbi:MAG: hypothetical protein LBD01_02775 [Puniceicoccales bacterium]|jgi:hypothetical protein|nr:hypothetical protein [Puniceicoccales bacterium]
MRNIIPGILAALASTCATLARENYKRIVSDEFVRGYLSTQGTFLSHTHGLHTALTGSLLTTPSALADGLIEQATASLSALYNWTWHTTKHGDIQPFLRISTGSAQYDGDARDIDGRSNDSVEGETATLSVGYGLRWRPWPNTTISLGMNYGYLYTNNDYTYAPTSTPIGDGSTRNWFAHAISSVTKLGFRQNVPLSANSWDKPASGKAVPCLTFTSNITSLSMFGAYGETNHQQRYVASAILSNGLELTLHLSKTKKHVTLFAERTDILFDGRRSLGRDKCFYCAGVRYNQQRENDTVTNWLDTIHLSASGIWGKDLNGWQFTIGLQF